MGVGSPKYPGKPVVINGNGAVANVMSNVCGGVIGFPITPSTEISELFEATRAAGGVNVWGKHPFFFEPEGEHSAQSGALGAALTGGQFISNASSSQGILYALESHYVTVGKKIGGFVLQVAARVVSKHSLNVMAGHDDIYALLDSGYTVLFGASPQEAADLAAISYRTSALSLIPVANTMDGFATSHMLSEARLPEPELLREYLGDPAGRIPCPTVAQEMLFGAKGRVFQLGAWLDRRSADVSPDDRRALAAYFEANAAAVEQDNDGQLVEATLAWIPEELRGAWRRQWVNAYEKGTRQMVPSLVDPDNPGLTGPVQNQPDFQAGAVDHLTHFASEVPGLVRRAMDEYAELTGRQYRPVHAIDCDDADFIMVGLGSVTEDVEAVMPYLRAQGLKVGVAAVKLLQPFPEAELVEAVKNAKAVMVLERSDQTKLTWLVTSALFKARENAVSPDRHPGVPALADTPRLTSAIFGLGGHDLQPRHLIAGFEALAKDTTPPLVFLGSQFFDDDATGDMAEIQARLRAAYPETELMALATRDNPPGLLPDSAMRIRFHSVGGYGTIATGKLLTDILAGLLGMYSKSAPKYGSEKSGAPTNYFITLSPEPIKITNAELEDCEIVISPDHQVFAHANPLKGLVEGGTLIMQSAHTPEQAWADLPRWARRIISEKKIRLFVVDAFKVAKKHAPTEDLETRMMGIAFIGAVTAHVDRVSSGSSREEIIERVRAQITQKFGAKGTNIVESNMAVIEDGIAGTVPVDYTAPGFASVDERPALAALHSPELSAAMCGTATSVATSGLFDPVYYEDLAMRPFREGTIGESPVLPGAGLFMPPGTAAEKDKGMFRRTVPSFDPAECTGCLECALVCPDAAIPNTAHELHDLLLTAIAQADLTDAARESLRPQVFCVAEAARTMLRDKDSRPFHEIVAQAVEESVTEEALRGRFAKVVTALAAFPVARTRPFFDSVEKENPGKGALFSAVVDPWKCTGCLECIDVCGPGALTRTEQEGDVLETLQQRFAFMSAAPATPARFLEGVTSPGGDVKRLMLDRDNFYSTTGGHGGCRGCGEVTAIRLFMATSHALGQRDQKQHLRELTDLVGKLEAKAAEVNGSDPARAERLDALLATLEKRLYRYEGGPTGNGPAGTIVANSTGCSSVYASTMPYNSYLDPWVNSLFQDAQPLAKGIFEGIAAQAVDDVVALRKARLELDDAYDPAVHDSEMDLLGWQNFTPEELELLPTVVTIGGDGASYDIGFGAMSRILTSATPIKMVVLNSGVYSNTGGQASTSSYIGQDSDLARFGVGNPGKSEARKELGVIASFHPRVFVCSTSTALHNHYLTNTLKALSYQNAPALLDVYTPCGSEHGISEAASSRRARLAVESRMSPVFVHDPRETNDIRSWFDLAGNPDQDKTWTTTTIQYVDQNGSVQLLTTPLTPAEFALGETRFKKQFRRLRAEEEERALPIDEYVELDETARAEAVPFVYATDADQRLIKVAASGNIVDLVEERRRNWHLLQFLSGQHESQLTSLHSADIAALQARYEEAQQARESSLDELARAMADLATSTGPVSPGALPSLGGAGVASAAPAPGAAPAAPAPAAAPAAGGSDVPVSLAPEDEHLCNDCGTCYQELPQVFEKATIVVDGAAQDVAREKPGAVAALELTDDVQARIARVKANCDAEIIR